MGMRGSKGSDPASKIITRVEVSMAWVDIDK